MGTYPNSWSKNLSIITFAINSTYREALGTSSFELIHGFLPRVPADNAVHFPVPKEVYDYRKDRYLVRQVAKTNLKKHRQNYQYYANRNRKEVSYSPGELVFVFERNVSSKVAKCLSASWKGPYRVVKKLSPNIYVVRLKKWGRFRDALVHTRHMKPFLKRNF